ncbi:unnamed protein product [Cuscuta campestris]|uniref:CDT1 Geminin-binding domain-containing protein n=1 Tax=Cuscuta campestris TaxID=132261 RepID=A0A484NP77_9ASTE|nr:unnamed protein product [Cuscuta campestris]
MEHTDHESREHGNMDMKDHNILFPISSQKSGMAKGEHLGTSFASSTPEKMTELSRVNHRKDVSELPENFRVLLNLFDRMVCSLRLLSLRKKPTTFKHISTQVEVQTGRKFLYGDLAKIIYILPEVVHIDKVRMHDEKTCCMKPDLKVTLHADALEDDREQSVFIHVSNVFRAKLIDLFVKHPEVSDIPEAILPEPLMGSVLTVQPDSGSLPVSAVLPPHETTKLLESSHLAPSFSSHFSVKAAVPEEKKTQLLVSSACSVIDGDDESSNKTGSELLVSPKSRTLKDSVQEPPPAGSSKVCEVTPMKLTSESLSNSVSLETPVQSTPRRSVSAATGDEKLKKVITKSALAGSNLTAKRSLMGDLEWGETTKSIFPEKEEIKGTVPSGNVTARVHPSSEVEESVLLSGKDERCLPLHQQRYIGLPKLARLIHNIFKRQQ